MLMKRAHIWREAALGETLVLTISGKSLNVSESVLSKYRREYYISEFGEV